MTTQQEEHSEKSMGSILRQYELYAKEKRIRGSEWGRKVRANLV